MLGGVFVALGLLLAACPTSSAGSGDSDGNGGGDGNGGANTTYAYICTNGTPVEGRDATADNITRCQSCQSGFIITADYRCNHRYICNNGTPTQNTDATADNVTQCASCTSGYLLTANNSCTNDLDGDRVLNDTDIDDDNDGLIEVFTLTMLHNMRYNLSGTGYDDEVLDTGGGDATGDNRGGPTSPTTDCTTATGGVYLCGYELTQDLTFDKNSDGNTFTNNNDGSITLDSNDAAAPYFVVADGGWLPIGDDTNPFVATFEANGYTITGLATTRNQDYVGMFGYIGTGAHIRNVGLVNNLANYIGSSNDFNYIGGLVGLQAGGSITASYTTGSANGGAEGGDSVGGLVGRQADGSITASYATGSASGGAGNFDYTGGLVGFQAGGSITASYASGSASGGAGNNDASGGLVGWQSGGSITASYTTGSADGGLGVGNNSGGLVGYQSGGSITASYTTGSANSDNAGGLVGLQANGSITASYATGSANGGGGNIDVIGGLVGLQAGGSITASYATASANGGAGIGDYVGQLIGRRDGGSHSASYGFGNESGGERDGIDASTLPTGITTAVALTAANLTGCVGIANEKAYTSQTTCEATSKTACTWASNACSGTVIDIDCSIFTAQPTCIATTGKPVGTWNGDIWNAAASGTAGAWDFGDGSQAPALRYADFDGSGSNYNCNQFPVGKCNTLIPSQR